jgi:hypothetical protein
MHRPKQIEMQLGGRARSLLVLLVVVGVVSDAAKKRKTIVSRIYPRKKGGGKVRGLVLGLSVAAFVAGLLDGAILAAMLGIFEGATLPHLKWQTLVKCTRVLRQERS